MTCLVLNQSKFQFGDVTEDEVLLEPLLVEGTPHTAKQNLSNFLQGRTGVKRNIGGMGRVRRRRKGRRRMERRADFCYILASIEENIENITNQNTNVNKHLNTIVFVVAIIAVVLLL